MQSETLLESSKVKMAALTSCVCVCVQRSGNFLSGCQCAFVARHTHTHQQAHTHLWRHCATLLPSPAVVPFSPSPSSPSILSVRALI